MHNVFAAENPMLLVLIISSVIRGALNGDFVMTVLQMEKFQKVPVMKTNVLSVRRIASSPTSFMERISTTNNATIAKVKSD